mmetsp:Transcript_9482/g.17587  ORF Transcript_9482/g.17587 Transcript_9482/m.17587 type:complete len:116 (-) Transcript_9482:124-471(-)
MRCLRLAASCMLPAAMAVRTKPYTPWNDSILILGVGRRCPAWTYYVAHSVPSVVEAIFTFLVATKSTRLWWNASTLKKALGRPWDVCLPREDALLPLHAGFRRLKAVAAPELKLK